MRFRQVKCAAHFCAAKQPKRIMNKQQQATERRFRLSDSTVNEYGYRLLTSGYQIEEYRKNPIGYYMHQREAGVVVRWDDLKIEDDSITGLAIINMANARGAQTLSELEHGFLNAASVGHIVVLEYSMEKELMLPGQTGPTITKWYNKECSLVDIPGNSNALAYLYDVDENILNLADMTNGWHSTIQIQPETMNLLKKELQLAANASTDELISSVTNLKATINSLNVAKENLSAENEQLQHTLQLLTSEQNKLRVGTLLDRALEDKKITVALKARLAADYKDNADGLEALLATMPAYQLMSDRLKARNTSDAEISWEWDDYEKNDPTGGKLKDLRANDPARYKTLFDKKFAA